MNQEIKATVALVLVILMVLASLFGAIWYDVTKTGGTLQSWLKPTAVVSLLGLIGGFGLLLWQLGKQHRNTLEAHRRQAQAQLRLDIYKEIAARIEATRRPLVLLGSTPGTFMMELSYIRRIAANRDTVPESRYSISFFQNLEQQMLRWQQAPAHLRQQAAPVGPEELVMLSSYLRLVKAVLAAPEIQTALLRNPDLRAVDTLFGLMACSLLPRYVS